MHRFSVFHHHLHHLIHPLDKTEIHQFISISCKSIRWSNNTSDVSFPSINPSDLCFRYNHRLNPLNFIPLSIHRFPLLISHGNSFFWIGLYAFILAQNRYRFVSIIPFDYLPIHSDRLQKVFNI